VLFLRNGRDAELEADRLGVEYGSGAGYDPSGVPRFLATLARVSEMSGRGIPNWLSTHPDPGSRVTRAEPVAGKFQSETAKKVNRDAYLDRIRGLEYGDSPKDGIVRGSEFLQPLLRIGLKFPDGWELTNGASAVLAQEPGTRHFMVLQEVEQPRGRTVGDVAIDSMRKAGYTIVDGSAQRINGNDAHVGVYKGTAKDVGKVTMRAAHIAVGRQMYVVAGFAPENEFDLVDQDFKPALQTFRQLSQQEAANIRPNRLEFYTVQKGDSWQSIAVRQGKSIVNEATLAIMNDHEVSAQPQPGDRVKIIVEG
jgi:predicted Zn-dependent protease